VAQAQTDEVCGRSVFQGFDSRLTVRPLVTAPIHGTPVVEFAVTQRGYAIATAQRMLVHARERGWSSIPLPEGVRGFAVTAPRELVVATKSRLIFIEPGKRQEIASPTEVLAMFGKGPLPPMELVSSGGGFQLVTGRGTRAYRSLVSVLDRPVALGWNAHGLSFVSQGTLRRWRPANANVLDAMVGDRGLTTARSSCVMPDGRVLLGLQRSTLLISEGYALPIVGFGAFCDTSGNSALLLDPDGGVVWDVRGLEDIGTAAADRARARKMLQSGGASRPETWAEVVRIAGCSQALGWRADASAGR
jgi:hypothetical protein